MDLMERIQRDQKQRTTYMASIVDTVEKIEKNYQAIQHINRRIDDINEGAWAYGFLTNEQRGRDMLKQLELQRRVLRMRKMLFNRLAAISQTKIEKANKRIDVTHETGDVVKQVFFGQAIMTKTA